MQERMSTVESVQQMAEINKNKEESTAMDNSTITIPDEDLEDGEIDDSDEDDNDSSDVIVVSVDMQQKHRSHHTKSISSTNGISNNLGDGGIVTIDLSNDNTSIPTQVIASSSGAGRGMGSCNLQSLASKAKKPLLLEDDHASSIENALANVLKKKGIEPMLPKVLESRLQQHDSDDMINHSPLSGSHSQNHIQSSRSSRRRKRKKQRSEKDRSEKERKAKKKRYDSPDLKISSNSQQRQHHTASMENDEDMDDYEMLNVRGGSPPPINSIAPPSLPSSGQIPSNTSHYKDAYNSEDDSEASSNESYESDGNDSGNEQRRRRQKRKKESRKRSERRTHEEERRSEKRSRRDSLDEKHRNEPRKLELCKFYLMECCAKKDKCSYMHSNFPCKYYYLGMECVNKDDCKFAHGEPLSEELRNILLKHLETAPKEILGNFKRISRETSVAMITKRHEELCVKFNVQNIWPPITANSLPIHNSRRNNIKGNGIDTSTGLQQTLQQPQSTTATTNNIPSLLDMVIKPPTDDDVPIVMSSSNVMLDKQRKSRWTDNAVTTTSMNIQPPSSSAPSYLDLKNLNGILSSEHIEKLSQLGIVNLEQVNQLTFGQLNQIGLTIAEISEIQLNAMNMAKLGIVKPKTLAPALTVISTTTAANASANTATADLKTQLANSSDGISSNTICNTKVLNGDVDMRFHTKSANGTLCSNQSADHSVCDTSNNSNTVSNPNKEENGNSAPILTVDYSQYLKDSNLAFDRSDPYDDERDDEQLIIDDGNLEQDESMQQRQQQQQQQQQQQLQLHHDIDVDSSEKKQTNNFDDEMSLTEMLKTIRNPFGSGGSTTTFYGSGEGACDRDIRQRRYSQESNSRSQTPPERSRSATPEACQSPQPFEQMQWQSKEIAYERPSMYDYCIRIAEEDEVRAAQRLKTDKDMRYMLNMDTGGGLNDVDLRLPFQPITNYTPATEIDGSITSHLPIFYKIYEIDVPRPSYFELRQHFKSDHTSDPRLRRILGLPELSQTKKSAALSRKIRKASHSSIASPDSEGSSPKYYTPPASSSSTHHEEKSKSLNSSTTATASSNATSHRGDPRRGGDPRRRQATNSSISNSNVSNSSTSGTISTTVANISGGQKQNVEIRNLLQKSDWYKNLNSKFKIMVNQQLALVSTELKKFHQDPSPNKIFDISFIVNNNTLQQILTNLGIYIDDNGEVAYVDNDADVTAGTDNKSDNNNGTPASGNLNLPNLSQPPPGATPTTAVSTAATSLASNTAGGNAGGAGGAGGAGAGGGGSSTNNNSSGLNANHPALDFLRAPPPNLLPSRPPPLPLGPMFQRPPLQMSLFAARPSLLGLPPPAHFTPFTGNLTDININSNANFMAGAGAGPATTALLGPFAGNFTATNALAATIQQHQHNFNNQRNRQQNRRNNKI